MMNGSVVVRYPFGGAIRTSSNTAHKFPTAQNYAAMNNTRDDGDDGRSLTGASVDGRKQHIESVRVPDQFVFPIGHNDSSCIAEVFEMRIRLTRSVEDVNSVKLAEEVRTHRPRIRGGVIA